MDKSTRQRVPRTTPNKVTKMDKPRLESPIAGARKESGERVDILDRIEAKLGSIERKQDETYTEMKDEMKEVKQHLSTIEKKVNENQAEVTQIKQNADELKAVVENMKGRVENNESLAAHNRDLQTKLQEMLQQQQDANIKLDFLAKTVVYQQSMLESTDAKFRANQVIIYGIDENGETLGTDDQERASKVIEKTNAVSSIGNIQVRRLGNQQENQSRPRPLLVILDDSGKQKKIIENSRNLKDVEGYSNIYIKKDKHPTVRFEENRLRKREKEEKNNPLNSQCRITYDYKNRVLLKDNTVIDRFLPSFR